MARNDDSRHGEVNERLNRRKLLRKLGTTSVVATGLVGSTTRAATGLSDSEKKLSSKMKTYQSKSKVVDEVEEHASSLVEWLSNRGYIKTQNTDKLVSTPNTNTGTRVVGFDEPDGHQVHITLELQESATLQIEPISGEAYAVLSEGDSERIIDKQDLSSDQAGVDTASTDNVAVQSSAYNDCCASYTTCVNAVNTSGNQIPSEVRIYCCVLPACAECRYEIVDINDPICTGRDPPICLNAC